MKQQLFDVILYLFENYIFEDEEFDPSILETELHKAGFQSNTIDKAFAWLDELGSDEIDTEQDETYWVTEPSELALRHYTTEEQNRLDVTCRGFMLFLQQMGVLDATTRERVIERVMALDSDDIDLEQLKWVVLMVIYNRPGYEAATVWLEDIVIDEMVSVLH